MSTLPNTPARLAPAPEAHPSGAKVLRFRRATKEAAKLRLALIGGSKSGKTYTALAIAQALVPGGRIAVIDTEHRSASRYAGPTATPHAFDFDTLELDSFHPRAYIDAIHAAEAEGYDVLIIDSLSHEWMGPDGALELVDRAAKKYAGNSYVAWGDVTPLHREMIETILKARLHVIATMRAKTEYVLEDRNGKKVPRKIGMAPVQREGIEYEFDVACELTQDHELSVMGSSRCEGMNDRVFRKAGADVAGILRAWISNGAQAATAERTSHGGVAAPPSPPPPPPPSSETDEPPPPPAPPSAMSPRDAEITGAFFAKFQATTTQAELDACSHAFAAAIGGRATASKPVRAWYAANYKEAQRRIAKGGAR